MDKREIYTIGHSTRKIKDFLGLLDAHGIKLLVDIRTVSRSRYNPQFNEPIIKQSLKNAGIGYRRIKKLGGFRHAKKDSKNLGWENLSFRGFADYMQTSDFAKGLFMLQKLAGKKKTAIMCAEAVPWRCHRSLIADALIKQKYKVLHISSRKSAKRHRLTPFLRVRKGAIVYPAVQ